MLLCVKELTTIDDEEFLHNSETARFRKLIAERFPRVNKSVSLHFWNTCFVRVESPYAYDRLQHFHSEVRQQRKRLRISRKRESRKKKKSKERNVTHSEKFID